MTNPGSQKGSLQETARRSKPLHQERDTEDTNKKNTRAPLIVRGRFKSFGNKQIH